MKLTTFINRQGPHKFSLDQQIPCPLVKLHTVITPHCFADNDYRLQIHQGREGDDVPENEFIQDPQDTRTFRIYLRERELKKTLAREVALGWAYVLTEVLVPTKAIELEAP